jgi:putative FmdB family regulatory protein
MPILEYQCHQCGGTFEHFTQRPMTAKAPVCPNCGTENAERVLSVFAGRTEKGGCGPAISGVG